MLRLIARGVSLSILFLLLVPAASYGAPAGSTETDPAKKTLDASTAAVASTDSAVAAEPAIDAEAGSSATAIPATPASPAQDATSGKKAKPTDEYKPAPIFTPTLATTGTLGMFTLETGDTLPKGGFAVSAFGNKFGRMPAASPFSKLAWT